MKKENPFDHKSMEKVLFAAFKHQLPAGRRTRKYLRKMARHLEHNYEIGYRDGSAKKALIPLEELLSPAVDGFKAVESVGGKTAGAVTNGLKAVAGAATAAAGSAVVVGKSAFDAYANYEQLVGGVETLFGAGGQSLEEYAKAEGKTVDEVADKYNELMRQQNYVMEDAAAAYKTAGMSANEYMETVTSFAASLKQSLGEENFWEISAFANEAVIDMSDNANKMGTDIERIQDAYQGFAKQNFTMLDNLKLDYGGTKTEMERLLRNAEKLEGFYEGSLHRRWQRAWLSMN